MFIHLSFLPLKLSIKALKSFNNEDDMQKHYGYVWFGIKEEKGKGDSCYCLKN